MKVKLFTAAEIAEATGNDTLDDFLGYEPIAYFFAETKAKLDEILAGVVVINGVLIEIDNADAPVVHHKAVLVTYETAELIANYVAANEAVF